MSEYLLLPEITIFVIYFLFLYFLFGASRSPKAKMQRCATARCRQPVKNAKLAPHLNYFSIKLLFRTSCVPIGSHIIQQRPLRLKFPDGISNSGLGWPMMFTISSFNLSKSFSDKNSTLQLYLISHSPIRLENTLPHFVKIGLIQLFFFALLFKF